MEPPAKEVGIKGSHQDLLIEGLDRFQDRILATSQECLEKTGLQVCLERMAQFVILALFTIIFGLTRGAVITLFGSYKSQKVRDYIANFYGSFPGGSTVTRQVGLVLRTCKKDPPLYAALEAIARALQDFFYKALGEAARAIVTGVLAKHVKVTAPAECFVGVINASEVFPALDAEALGRVLPFFNAWVYKQSQRATSTAEFIGDLKTPSIEGGKLAFAVARELGFFCGVPEAKKFYANFANIEANIDPAWDADRKSVV